MSTHKLQLLSIVSLKMQVSGMILVHQKVGDTGVAAIILLPTTTGDLSFASTTVVNNERKPARAA